MADEKLQAGRVIYGTSTWKVQTLNNHVGNVVQLVKLWNSEKAFLYDTPPTLPKTRDYLIRAAEIHDMGKPQRFQITFDPKKEEWSYSFAGHRFLARDYEQDTFTPYVEGLAHLHHEYSVGGITRHMAQLKLNAQLSSFAEHLPLDLYVLEMCDQIEATIGSTFLGEKEHPTARVFMDFQFKKNSRPYTYCIDPFVFSGEAVILKMEWAEIVPDMDLVTAVRQQANKNDAYSERRQLRNWLIEQLNAIPLQTQEVTLCPWTT
jgi:hypothetical protein